MPYLAVPFVFAGMSNCRNDWPIFVYWSGVSALPRFPRRPRVGRGQSRLYFLFGVGLAFAFGVGVRAASAVIPHGALGFGDFVTVIAELQGKPEPGIVPAFTAHAIKRIPD